MTSPRPSALREMRAAIVGAALVLQPLGAYAAATTSSPLAENPLRGASVRVKPNIMFTVDATPPSMD